jgi:hypothetical protein
MGVVRNALLLGLLALCPATEPAAGAASEQARVDERTPQAAAHLERLREAFDTGSAAQRIAALRDSWRHADEAVVAQVRRGLGDRDVEVRLAAYDALGRNAHENAFAALLTHHRERRKELRTQDRDLPALLAALARRGDARAIAPLVADVQAQRLVPTIRARILGLARIRTKDSVEALMKLADEVGFVDMHNHLEDFRLALVVLSGVDHGRSLDAWRAWWRGTRETFAPPQRVGELAPADAVRWREFWGEAPPSGDAR